MRWAAPEWRWIALALFALSAGLTVWSAWRRRGALERFGKRELVEQLRGASPAAMRAVRAVFFVLGLSLVALTLARPQGRARTDVVARRGIDIVVCLDLSKSMLARDVSPSRIARARAELRRLMEEEPGDRFGIVLFAGDTLSYPLTTDHEAALRFLREVEPWNFPRGGTSIGRAITAADELFRHDPLAARRSKVVIVLTDGEDLEGDPVEAARAAASNGVQVFIDAIGSTAPEPIPQYTPDGRMVGFERDSHGNIKTTQFTPQMETQLRNVAQAGNGRYTRAAHGEVGIESVRRELARLRRSEIAASQQTVFDELMSLFAVPGFVLLVLASLWPERWPFARRKTAPATTLAKREAKR